MNHREVDLEFLPTDASPHSSSPTCLLGDTLRSLLRTLVQWFWLCPFTLPLLPPAILLCTGIEFLGGDGIVSAYLGLVACPGCSCLPWEEGGSGSQDLPFGELLTPIWSGCKQVTFAEVLGGKPDIAEEVFSWSGAGSGCAFICLLNILFGSPDLVLRWL